MPTLLPELTSLPVQRKNFSPSFTQSLLSLILIIGLFVTLFHNLYNGLGRRIQTTSQGSTVSYYYDPCVEFLELGHSLNGNRTWNLFGPDRSGTYGGAQGIGGLEAEYDQNSQSSRYVIDNFFGDVLGYIQGNNVQYYPATLGAYGPMPGSAEVNESLEPQWRGHYADWTGFYSMGARYYEPGSGRFLSADPLGHGSSLSLYDYCDGDPVNGMDPDERCAKGGVKGYTMGGFAEYDNIPQAIGGFVGTGLSYLTPGLGEVAAIRDLGAGLWNAGQALSDIWDNGLHWENGLKLGFSAVGAGLGGRAIVGPAKAAVEIIGGVEVSSAAKTIPNPGGRLGDAVTRQTTQNVIRDAQARGFTDIQTEVFFQQGPLGAKNRFIDVLGTNPQTGESLIINIGKTTKSGAPIMRERQALDDIIFSPTIQQYLNSQLLFIEKGAGGL